MIELLAARSSPTDIERLIRDLAAMTPISWSRARNTITKLAAYGVIRTAGAGTVIVDARTAVDWRAEIAQHVASELTISIISADAWSCLELEPATGAVKIDAMLLPLLPDGLAVWVTDFGVAERSSVASRHWTVAADYKPAFLSGASDANRAAPRRSKSAERLAADLARQAEYGDAAEEWVLEFERQRLRRHPLKEQVRRVSVDDVAAGYDILSFKSKTSLRHDLFIEVKSYAASKAFHWSRNEIATAREFGESYALYLVDRTRCADSGYIPQIIAGPSPEMFALSGSGWRVEATSFEHIAVSNR